MAEGIDREGFAIDQILVESGERTISRRAWGTCEYLKACAAEADADASVIPRLSREPGSNGAAGLSEGFLATPKPGLWFDRLDAYGKPLSPDAPASSFYHITLALMECQRCFGRVSAAPRKEIIERRPALFLDRDGVLNRDTGYPAKPADIEWVDSADAAIRAANMAGYRVIVISNQSAVARNYATESEILRLHEWMASELEKKRRMSTPGITAPFMRERSILHIAVTITLIASRTPE